MLDFLIRRGGFWLLQWARCISAITGILTFGYVDFSLEVEGKYLDAMFWWHQRKESK